MHKLLNVWCKEAMSEDIGSQTDLALNSPAPFINRVTLGTFLNLFESLLICKIGMKILTISNGCYEAFTFIIVTRISIKMYYGRTRRDTLLLHQHSCLSFSNSFLSIFTLLFFLLHPLLPTRSGFILHILLSWKVISSSELSAIYHVTGMCLVLEETN